MLTSVTSAAGPVLVACVLCVLPCRPAGAQELPAGPVTLANGRISLGSDISFSTSTDKDNDDDPAHSAWFNYTDYEHNTLRLMRIGVSADVRVTDRLSLLGEVRSENGDRPHPYAMYVRVRPWKNGPVTLEAGRIPLAFGAFARRAYANGNPLIGYPLAYQYLTSLRADAIPADVDELLRMRARGWRPSYRIGSQSIETGMPLITAFRWDTGAQATVGGNLFSVTTAVTVGTISDPHTKDNNQGKQISAHAQWQPVVGLVLGASGARGPYLSDQIATSRTTERAVGTDAEYSRDHWLVRGEAIWAQWEVPTLAPTLSARSGFVEGSYKIRPGVFAAFRADRETFNRVTGTLQTRTWDAPVTRIETGVGFYIRRNFLARTSYQHNWRDGGLIRTRRLVALQFQYWL